MWAWQQRSTLDARRQALQSTVKSAFPRVSELDVQRDAAAVMQRELQALRTLAGRAGENDLETLLLAAASAWPAERPPVDNLRFENGRLSLAAAGWSEQQIAQFRSLLQPAGWAVEASEGRLTLSRAAPGVRS